jgi:DNA-binding NtrC family response regulator
MTNSYVNAPWQPSIWHNICSNKPIVVLNLSKLEEINVLASEANWAWPVALHNIFRPRDVNLLVAESPSEFVNIIQRRRIHATIVDMDSERPGGLATIRIIRMNYPLLPCILLTSVAEEVVLSKALQLDVFSVIGKPVDMSVLRGQLNRLFKKKYNCDIFK